MTPEELSELKRLAVEALESPPEGCRDPHVWAEHIRKVHAYTAAVDPETILRLLAHVEALDSDHTDSEKGLIDIVNALADECDELQDRIDRALATMSEAPECDKYTDEDAIITCGWKSDLIRVRRVLSAPSEGETDE